jgi:DNA-binding MarR family transcriptional regulator
MYNNDLPKIADSFLDFLWLTRDNVFNLNDLTKISSFCPKSIKDCIEDCSIPPSHVKVILYLTESNSSPISQIAANLGISKSNMTPIIDNLIRYDLVNRYNDPKDRRILRVELTEKAYELFEFIRSSIKNLCIEKLNRLSNEELIILDSSIANLSGIMKKLK